MSGNSLRDQLSGLMLERQKARDKTQLLNKEGKEKVVKTQSAAVSKNTPTGQKKCGEKKRITARTSSPNSDAWIAGFFESKRNH